MEGVWYPLLAALAVMSISLAGVMFTIGRFGTWFHRKLTYFATFAAGVFIIVAWQLAEEAVHEGRWIIGLVSICIGALLMESINFFFPAHHHHGTVHDHAHTEIDGRRVLLSDALHNIGDGILIAAAFNANIYIGVAATVGVLLHELVQEISEFFVLKESGYTDRRALTFNFLVSSTILIGILLTFALSSVEIVLAILAGLAAGGFLSVLLHDLLPHALASIKAHGRAHIHFATLILGAGLMYGIGVLVPHEEASENEEAPASAPALVEDSVNPSSPGASIRDEAVLEASTPLKSDSAATEMTPAHSTSSTGPQQTSSGEESDATNGTSDSAPPSDGTPIQSAP